MMAGAFADLPVGLDVEWTLVVGDTPRATRMALWSTERTLDGADAELTLVLPAGRSVRRRVVPVRLVALAEVLDELIALRADAGVSDSLRVWSVAARLSAGMIARGRLVPGTTRAGDDCWQLGPFDPEDLLRQHQMAAALPPSAFCVGQNDAGPVRLLSPSYAVRCFGDAVADTVSRTAAMALAAGHGAYADAELHPVGQLGGWFASNVANERVTLSMRLIVPDDENEGFAAELALQSPDDPSLVIPASELWDAPDLVMDRFADAEEVVLVTLRRAARVWPPVGRFLDQARPGEIALDHAEVDEILGAVADHLAETGLFVQWPAELLAPLELRPTITTPQVANILAGGLDMDALLSWRPHLDGIELTDDEVELLANAKRGILRLRGRWVRADPDRLARLRERRRLTAGEALAVALGGTLDVDGVAVHATVTGGLVDLAQRLAEASSERERPAPPDLAAELRPYQRRGLAWLVQMADLGLGGVLADDMGLGKTIQVIALHLERAAADGESAKPTLVVCPASLLANWQREANRFASHIPVRRYHGGARSLDDLAVDEIVLTTYGVVRRDAAELASHAWGLVIADEAQAIKNPHSRSAKSLRVIGADARFALTGTPVENQLSELWAICDFTTPGLLGSLDRFRSAIAIPVERDRDPEVSARLVALLRPFLLRRRKSDPTIAPDLPPKTETDQFVPLSAEQITLYRAVVDESLEAIREAEGIARRGLVLKLLTSLKQICNHPAQHLGQSTPLGRRSGKLDAAAELLDTIRAEGDASLVFTQYVVMGHLLEGHLAERGHRVAFLHGSLTLAKRQVLVDAFQAGSVDTFVISLKAGGTGLNLTAATHVVHYDRWWNPAVEDQASDRAWRIGQDRPVQVHRMICEGTVEDRIAVLLERKRELAERVVGGGEGWITELGDDELAALVELSVGTSSMDSR